MDQKNEKLKFSLRIPFHSQRFAEIACSSLSADKEPNPTEITRTMSVENSELVIEYHTANLKLLRTAVSSLFDLLFLLANTFS
ncbi:hypothetical protein BB560_005739, partial [Smittium megazygosporum]